VEEISYVIIDQSSMEIHAFSTNGRQVTITYKKYDEFLYGISKCEKWLPHGRILSKV